MASLTDHRVFKTLGGLAHATAKMGIVGLTKQLAMKGHQHGVRANSISPGVYRNKIEAVQRQRVGRLHVRRNLD